jgi:hypothetical protein
MACSVEIWFARLEREVIARGATLGAEADALNPSLFETAKPFKWRYTDVRRRILPC